jgi:hydroxymethylbilane synthase
MKKLGTRGSDLALTQSRHIAQLLEASGTPCELVQIITQGDRVTHLSLDKIEGKGFFTTEIEQALLSGRIDLAVHSLKDLPAEPTDGLCIAAIPAREDVRDTLIIHKDSHAPSAPLWPIARGTVVGTSAVRRKAQMLWHRPDLKTYDLRGNVPTRVRKLSEGKVGAILLAEAGLRRLQLDLSDFIVHRLAPDVFVPAPGQGALALQCRQSDTHTVRALTALHHTADATLVQAERGLLALLKAGCHVPLGAHGRWLGQELQLHVFFGGQGQGTTDTDPHPAERFTVGAPNAEAVSALAFAHLQATRAGLVGALAQSHTGRPQQFVP